MTTSQWQWANDTPVWMKPRRTVYFLVRHIGDDHDDWSKGEVQYRRNKRGSLITYSTREQAMRIVARLNQREDG